MAASDRARPFPSRKVLIGLAIVLAAALVFSVAVRGAAHRPASVAGRSRTSAVRGSSSRPSIVAHAPTGPGRPVRCIVARPSAPASAAVAGQYTKLVWSDEFSGPAGSPPNRCNWIHDVGPWGSTQGNLDIDTGSTANTSLDGQGHLTIVARHQQSRGPDGRIFPYTSARIETQGHFSFKYGRIEARMELPPGTGLWPQFWMLGDNVGQARWPQSGEIDIMEEIGQDPRAAFGSIHGPQSGPNGSYALEYQVTRPTSLASGFHIFGVIWRRGSITWTLDGNAYATVTLHQLPSASTWSFEHPFHIVLNLAVGGTWPGTPTASTPFPAYMRVHWVRVYQ